jgi:hypothetical protein
MRITSWLPAFASANKPVTLGLADNWRQVALLVATNMFVGGMIGMERTILPGLAESEFGITSKTAVVSFIATFGLAKAGSNLLVGPIAQRFTRRRILIAGWMIGIQVPLLLIWATLARADLRVQRISRLPVPSGDGVIDRDDSRLLRTSARAFLPGDRNRRGGSGLQRPLLPRHVGPFGIGDGRGFRRSFGQGF